MTDSRSFGQESKALALEQPPQLWSGMVQRIQAGDPAALEELYRIFTTGIRFYLCRQLGPQDLDDRLHDVFLVITQAIQRGDLRDPERLMGYVRTVVRRQIAASIATAVEARRNIHDGDFQAILSDRHPDPERRAMERQNIELALSLLNSLPLRDREVLVRFYLKEQSPNQVCRDMALTHTQFRLIKSRAKARFTELGRARIAHRNGYRQPVAVGE